MMRPLMEFVRGGWSNPANQRHPAIQRVEYWWRDGRIERVGYAVADGGEPPEPATLFDHVTDVQLRYRAPKGEWLDVWQQQPNQLPVAVELVITRAGEAPLTVRFLVGAAVGQDQDQPAPSADDPDDSSGGAPLANGAGNGV